MASGFKWVGQRLSLDFHNTASWDGGEVVGDERLLSYLDLVSWAREAELLTAIEARDLVGRARADPKRAARVLADGLVLRGLIHGIYTAIAANQEPKPRAVAALNRILGRLPLRIRSVGSGRFAWDWAAAERGDLDCVLWPVLWDCVALLQADDALTRVKACAAARCGWLFLDVSRRGNRRWCDMADCGNRAKVRRFQQRHRRRRSRTKPRR